MKKFSLVFCFVTAVILFMPTVVFSAVDTVHLEQAKESIKYRHYQKGYIQFKKMAQHGCPFSQCLLGIMHQKGLGAQQSSKQAFYWFKKSAEQGFADAEWRLGSMYYRGDGISADLNLARQWLRKAVDHGVDEARQLLEQIPGEGTIAADTSALPQSAIWTVNNIRQAWQGYSDVAKQLDQSVASIGSQ